MGLARELSLSGGLLQISDPVVKQWLEWLRLNPLLRILIKAPSVEGKNIPLPKGNFIYLFTLIKLLRFCIFFEILS